MAGRKKWIQGAVKHPGIEKAKAKRAGISTHAQLVKDSHSSNPKVRGRGLLGLRFQHGLGHDEKKRGGPVGGTASPFRSDRPHRIKGGRAHDKD